jgi:hypothetical protein
MGASDDNLFQIPELTNNQTFLDWFNKTNDDIIGKLNSIKIFDGASGDGIDVSIGTTAAGTGTAGFIQVKMAETVTRGVTFNNLTVSGSFNYDFSGSEIKSSTQFTGITGGYTFANVIRPDYTLGNSMGITLARGANANEAEAIGIVSTVLGNKVTVVTNGKIQGDFGPALGADGVTLHPGCVYFVDPTTYGGLTTNEPNLTTQVSKPILVGLTGDTGIVLNYRGQEVGFSGGTGAGIGSLKLLIDVGSGNGSNFEVGRFISKNSLVTSIAQAGEEAAREVYSNVFYASSADPFVTGFGFPSRKDLLGVISSINGDILEVVVRGYLPPNIIKTTTGDAVSGSPLYLSTDDNQSSSGKIFAGGQNSNILIGHITDTSGTLFIDPIVVEQDIVFANSNSLINGGSGVSFGIPSTDVVINGSFDVWQRQIGTTQEYEGNSASSSLYFADRWVFMNGITTETPIGGTFGIQRKEFTKGQEDVLGEPTYYARITNNYGRVAADDYEAGDFIHVENRLDTSEYFMEQPAVISVYTRSGSAGNTLAVLYKQYFDDGAGTTLGSTTTTVGEIELATGWNPAALSFTVPGLSGQSITGTEEYAAIAFDIKGVTGTFLDLSQLQFELGSKPTSPSKKDSDEVLNECRKFYQRSYDKEVGTAAYTMLDLTIPNLTVVDIPIRHSKDYYYNFPVEMRKAPHVYLYSPDSGVQSDAYNRLAQRDMRLTSGTIGPNNVTRVSEVNQPTIQAGNTLANGIIFEIVSGAVVGDQVSVHYVADADNKKNL